MLPSIKHLLVYIIRIIIDAYVLFTFLFHHSFSLYSFKLSFIIIMKTTTTNNNKTLIQAIKESNQQMVEQLLNQSEGINLNYQDQVSSSLSLLFLFLFLYIIFLSYSCRKVSQLFFDHVCKGMNLSQEYLLLKEPIHS